MEMVGKPLLPWQRAVVRDAFGIRADGKWASYEVCLLEARQNGKGVLTETQELFGAYMLREEKTIHSAHLFDTSREAFMRLVQIIDGSDWLTRRTARVNRAHGKEGIELTRAAGGGEIKFKARTLHGTRGFSGGRIILDEAYGLTVGQFQAISPILATLPNPQVTYTSSPPDDKTGPMPDDAMLPSIRKRGLAGDPRMAFLEWSPQPGDDPEDVNVWYACNPSLGYLIEEEYLASQLRIFKAADKVAGFATEHLGAWPPDENEQWLVVSAADWAAAEGQWGGHSAPVAFAVELALDRSQAAVAVATRRSDGLRQVQVAALEPGTAWVVPWLVERVKRWKACALVLDTGGPAGSLVAELESKRVELLKPSTREYAAACGAFVDGLAGDVRDIRHTGQDQLTAAVAGLRRRQVAETSVFERSGDGFLASAAALALWGHTVKAPVRKSVVNIW